MEALKVFIFSILNPFKAFRIIKKKWGFKIYWFTALLILLTIVIYSFTATPRAIKFSDDTQDSQVVKKRAASLGKAKAPGGQLLRQLGQFSNIGSSGNAMQFISMLTSPLVQIISWLFIALVYWGLVYIFRNKTEYSKILTIVVISSVPILISTLVNLFYTLFTGKMIMHTGLSGLVASGNVFAYKSNLLYMILSRVDIFILWGLILLIIGIAIACKMKVWKSILIVLVVYVLILNIIVVITTSSISTVFLGGIFPK
ncbi:MAG: YIP1 family protein [Candidatus Humimicrobiia bacterium]